MTLPTAAAKHSAAAQSTGYGLQLIRLCYHLLTGPVSSRVSLEYLDDVAIHFENGDVLLEQCKSGKSNVLADASIELWKTLANWAQTTVDQKLDPRRTRYQLYAVPAKAPGAIAKAMDEARNDAEADAVLAKIVQKWPSRMKRPGCSEHLDRFLAQPLDLQRAIICGMRIESQHASGWDCLNDVKKFVPNQAVADQCLHAAIGDAKEQAERMNPAIISAERFVKSFRQLVSSADLGLLLPFRQTVNAEDAAAMFGRRPQFVRQLELIDLPKEDQERSVTDYLQSEADKTR